MAAETQIEPASAVPPKAPRKRRPAKAAATSEATAAQQVEGEPTALVPSAQPAGRAAKAPAGRPARRRKAAAATTTGSAAGDVEPANSGSAAVPLISLKPPPGAPERSSSSAAAACGPVTLDPALVLPVAAPCESSAACGPPALYTACLGPSTDSLALLSYTPMATPAELAALVGHLTGSLSGGAPVYIAWQPGQAQGKGGKSKAIAKAPPASSAPQPSSASGDPAALPVGLSIAWLDPAAAAAASGGISGQRPLRVAHVNLATSSEVSAAADPDDLTPSAAVRLLRPLLHAGMAHGSGGQPAWTIVTANLKTFAKQCAACGVPLPAPPAPHQYMDTLAAGYVLDSEMFLPKKSTAAESTAKDPPVKKSPAKKSTAKEPMANCLAAFLQTPRYEQVLRLLQERLAAGSSAAASDPRVAAAAEVVHNALCHARLQQVLAAVAQEARGCGASEYEELDPTQLIWEVEVPVQVLLADMERTGMAMSVEGMRELQRRAEERMEEIQAELLALPGAGEGGLKLGIVADVRRLLFDRLRVHEAAAAAGVTLKHTAKNWELSTDQEALERLLPHDTTGAVKLVQEFRKLDKLVDGYTGPFLQQVDQDGVLRSQLNQFGTATGRLSSSGANVMALPKDLDGHGELLRGLRRQLVARPGCVLLAVDYSQVELRVLAHLTRDEAMMSAFKGGVDVHTQTASRLYRKPISAVTPEERQAGKEANFGIVYGVGFATLARNAGIDAQAATAVMTNFQQAFATCTRYMNVLKARCIVGSGFVTSMCGRRRPFRGKWESKRDKERVDLVEMERDGDAARAAGDSQRLEELVKALAAKLDANVWCGENNSRQLRELGNMRFQGSTADIAKAAMVRTCAALATRGSGASLLLMVHDELLFEVPEAELPGVAAVVKAEMEAAAALRVPLTVEMEVGRDMLDMRPYSP